MTAETLIRIHRNKKDVGYFTPETALEYLRSGVLRADDWAYCEGLLDWTPLGELLGFADAPATSASALSPPPLPPVILTAVPPVIPAWVEPKRKTPVAALIMGGTLVCFLGLLFVAFLTGSSPTTSSSISTPTPRVESNSNGEGDAGLLPPLKNYDVNAEPIEAVPELGMSKADVANLREWMAAGSPRYWKGKDQFPGMSQEQWEQWRKSTREH